MQLPSFDLEGPSSVRLPRSFLSYAPVPMPTFGPNLPRPCTLFEVKRLALVIVGPSLLRRGAVALESELRAQP